MKDQEVKKFLFEVKQLALKYGVHYFIACDRDFSIHNDENEDIQHIADYYVKYLNNKQNA